MEVTAEFVHSAAVRDCGKLKKVDGGAVAQLGARLDGIEEVVGSNPIGSTILRIQRAYLPLSTANRYQVPLPPRPFPLAFKHETGDGSFHYLSNVIYESKARLSTFVSCILLREAFSAFVVACKQKGCMIIAVWNHVRSAIDHFPFQVNVKFREFRPVDPGMLMVLEMKTYIEHREVEEVRHKYSRVAYRFSGSLRQHTPNAVHTCPNP